MKWVDENINKTDKAGKKELFSSFFVLRSSFFSNFSVQFCPAVRFLNPRILEFRFSISIL